MPVLDRAHVRPETSCPAPRYRTSRARSCGPGTRHLDADLNGFVPVLDEEGARNPLTWPGDRRAGLVLVVVCWSCGSSGGLLPVTFTMQRVAVPQRVHAITGDEIQITLAASRTRRRLCRDAGPEDNGRVLVDVFALRGRLPLRRVGR